MQGRIHSHLGFFLRSSAVGVRLLKTKQWMKLMIAMKGKKGGPRISKSTICKGPNRVTNNRNTGQGIFAYTVPTGMQPIRAGTPSLSGPCAWTGASTQTYKSTTHTQTCGNTLPTFCRDVHICSPISVSRHSKPCWEPRHTRTQKHA